MCLHNLPSMARETPIIPEVVEPDEKLPRDLVALRKFAYLMDEAVRIPGTGRGIGLDAALGFIPGIGDVIGGLLSAWIIVGALRHRVPLRKIIRMVVNVLLDMLIGEIPVIGDIFDIAFEENLMNMRLLLAHRDRSRRRGRFRADRRACRDPDRRFHRRDRHCADGRLSSPGVSGSRINADAFPKKQNIALPAPAGPADRPAAAADALSHEAPVRRARPGVPADDARADRRAALPEGNRVEILKNGVQIFPSMLAAIRGARRRRSISSSTSTGTARSAEQFAEALAERARAGVQVKVILDAVGSAHDVAVADRLPGAQRHRSGVVSPAALVHALALQPPHASQAADRRRARSDSRAASASPTTGSATPTRRSTGARRSSASKARSSRRCSSRSWTTG